jgi:peptidoglycan/LPS O-acetylase OafA/YrhL
MDRAGGDRSGGAQAARRPALDGLRAVAVLAVMAYHFGWPVPGGFLGVDAFFVLSGYLITSLLLTEYAVHGRIDLPAFWARRVRRLLPAALLLLVTVAVVVRLTAPVMSLDARRADLIATLLHYANWHFIASDESYFAQYSGASPVRHAWSLAIEEQFYLVWPLVVLLLLRAAAGRTRGLAALVAGAAVASAVAMAATYDVSNPSRAYFGTETRAHQLLLGALLAVLLHRFGRVLLGHRAAIAARTTGVITGVLLGALLFAVADSDPLYYGGLSACFALLVATLIWTLEAGPSAPLSRLLSVAPLVGVGRISYGLYLWHWPVSVWLLEDAGAGALSLGGSLLALLLSFAAAILSFRYVEQPARTGSLPGGRRVTPRRVAVLAPLAVLAVTGSALGATANPGSVLARQVEDHSVAGCPRAVVQTWCVRVAPRHAAAPVTAVAGDSTSLALDPGMRVLASERGWGYVQAGRNGCSFLPLALGRPDLAAQAEQCGSSAQQRLEEVTRATDPSVWIVSDSFIGSHLHTSAGALRPDTPAHRGEVVAALRTAFSAMTSSGARVVVLRVPPPGEPVDCAIEGTGRGCGGTEHSPAHAWTRAVNGYYAAATDGLAPRVVMLDVDDLVCPGPAGQCVAARGDQLIRYDGVHYTAGFSRWLAPRLAARLDARGFRWS